MTLGIGGAPGLGTAGSAWDLAFSNDAHADVHVRGRRRQRDRAHHGPRAGHDPVADLAQPGLQAGQFTFLHSITVDSKGNLYTGETINGRRMQKFVHVECNNGNGKGNGNGNCS